MHDIETRRAMQPAYSAYGPQTRAADADIVNTGSQQIPLACPGLLVQREYLNIVVERESLNEGQQCRDHTVLSRSINAPRYYQRDAHIVARRAVLPRP